MKWFLTTRFVELIHSDKSMLHKETLDLVETVTEATSLFFFDCFDAGTASPLVFFLLAP
jgi:hypothetical protein